MTPYTMAGDINTSNPSDKAVNIAILLQSFDGNRSNSSVLNLSKLKDYNFTDVNLSIATSDMTTKLSNMFADNNFSAFRDTTNNTPVTADVAKAAMKAYVDAELEKLKTPASAPTSTNIDTTKNIYIVHGINKDYVSLVTVGGIAIENTTTCKSLGYTEKLTSQTYSSGITASIWTNSTDKTCNEYSGVSNGSYAGDLAVVTYNDD